MAAAGCGGGSAGPIAPTIRDLQLEPRVVYESATPVLFTVGFDLFDPNRDVQSATFVLRAAGGAVVDQQTIPFSAPVAGLRISGSAATALPQLGTFAVELWTTDAAGLASNALTTTVDVVPHPWTDLPPDPVLRLDAAAAAVDGQVYVIGGSDQGQPVLPGPSTPFVARFDPGIGAWAPSQQLLVSRRAHCVAVADGRIYAIGGTNAPTGLGLDTAHVERFDPTTQTWAAVAPMPTARIHAAAATVAGRIYVVGGGSSAVGAVDTVVSYDPALDTWRSEPPMPWARHRPRAAEFDGKLVVVGGGNAQYGHVPRVDVFDPATGTWSNALRFFDHPCTFLANVGGRLYAGGGPNGTLMFRAAGVDLMTWDGVTGSRWSHTTSASAAAAADGIFVFDSTSAARYVAARELF